MFDVPVRGPTVPHVLALALVIAVTGLTSHLFVSFVPTITMLSSIISAPLSTTSLPMPHSPSSVSNTTSTLASSAAFVPPMLQPISLPPLPSSSKDTHIKHDTVDQELSRLLSHASNPPARAPLILFRMLGNDLPPRHAVGQTISNVRFILEHEPIHPGLDTRWYLNRILHRTNLLSILRLLVTHNATFVHEGFNASSFRTQTTLRGPVSRRSRDVLRSYIFGDSAFQWPFRRGLRWDSVFDVRNQFVIRNNAARNDMIELAFEAGAEYALPWDGNCFMNERAWTNISAVIMQHGLRLNHTEFNDSFTFSTINKTFTTARTTTNTTNTAITLPNSTITDNPMPHNYFFVPMARIIDNLLLINSSYMPPSVLEEPQLIFSRNALERFDESKPYGRRPKVDLLWRLRIPGPWGSFGGMDRWRTSSDVSEDRPVLAAGWTARLSSGVPNLEGPGKGTARGASRTDGVERISAVAVQRMLKKEKGVTFNETMTVYNRDVIDGLVRAVEKDVVERMEIEEGGRGGKERESDQMMVEEGNKQETENKQSEAKEKEERKEMVTARILATLLTLINGTIPDSSVTSSLLSSSSSPNSTVISNTHHAAASTLRTSTTTSFQNASSSPLSAEATMLFRIRANAAVHAVFRWMLLDHSESARLHARAALADAFVVNATRVAMNVRDHAMTVCALLDAARVATWDGGVWLSDDNDDEKKELNDVNGVDWARELVNVLEKDEMAPYYSSKERELAAELERAEAEDGNDNINIDSDLEMGSESSISTNRSTTTNTSISILTTTASFNSSIDSDRPLFYRRGADGIAFELCAACAHIFLSASSFHSPNSTVDDFHMVLRRTALAAQRLAWYVDMDGLADVSDLKAVDDSTKHEMSDAATLTMDTRTLGLWILHAAVSKTVDVDVWGYGFEPEVMKRAVTEREKKIGKKERGDGCYGEDEDECKAWLPMLFDRALRFWDDDYDDERKNENNDKRFRKDSETDYSVSEDEELWRMWIRWTGRCARKTADELESEEMKEDIDNDERRTRKQIADMSADDIVALELGGRRAGLPPFWTLAGVNCRWTL